MNPSRILPDLQCSLLCEEVRQEINGNFILIGVINYVGVPQLPIVAPRICVFNRWTAGVGDFIQSVRLIGPDQTTVLRKGEVKIQLPDPTAHATSVIGWAQVQFEKAGTYYIEVLVDDVMKLRYPLTIHLVQPPPGSQQGGAPQGPA
jgi:hypothetical protein